MPKLKIEIFTKFFYPKKQGGVKNTEFSDSDNEKDESTSPIGKLLKQSTNDLSDIQKFGNESSMG